MSVKNKKTSNRIENIIGHHSQQAVSLFFSNGDFTRYEESKNVFREYQRFIVLTLAQYDPTSNHPYTQWLVKLYESSKFSLDSDIYAMQCLIEYFDQNKQRLEQRDIQKYDLRTFLHTVKGLKMMDAFYLEHQKATDKEYEDYLLNSNSVTKVMTLPGDSAFVLELKDFEAAFYYAHKTKWCIRDEDVFAFYQTKGSLYLLISANERYLFQCCYYSEELSEQEPEWQVEFADSKNNLITNFNELYKTLVKTDDCEIGTMLYWLVEQTGLQQQPKNLADQSKLKGVKLLLEQLQNYFVCKVSNEPNRAKFSAQFKQAGWR